MKYHQVKTYHVFSMPKKTGYKMLDMLVVNVSWDDSYYLATLVDEALPAAYGTGKTASKAIKDLLFVLTELYTLDAKYARKGKLGAQALARHNLLGMVISKR